MTKSKSASKATSYVSNMLWNVEPSVVFHKEKSCMPLASLPTWPAGYFTWSTGPVRLAVEAGADLFEKGSATKAMFPPPCWILPLLSDQPFLMKDCASELESVAVGKGMDVLVVRE